MHTVKIKSGCTHRSGKCKAGDVIQVGDDELAAFGDKFELVHQEAMIAVEPEEVDATAGAIELAEAVGLYLPAISGSGRDGRITKSDVEAIATLTDEMESAAFSDKFEIAFHVEKTSATAAAIEFAKDAGLDLSKVEGSGRDGRITKADVESFVVGA